MKTNKSYAKRIKKTKNGKLISRKAGGNHYNAKERRSKQLSRKGGHALMITTSAKTRSRFIDNLN
ncbi:MAG: 50S ribosomal protein L35 [Candidatus Pacebacteria bacterium]|nr:50S ribosomal protein L35 [Candidatus Paceibacterota bacterium]